MQSREKDFIKRADKLANLAIDDFKVMEGKGEIKEINLFEKVERKNDDDQEMKKGVKNGNKKEYKG
ncbi:MAG: hypothetical protein N2V75_12430 [Methanophagales archaeon]|nr:hypothetical protein [Methanophagales archaeon]